MPNFETLSLSFVSGTISEIERRIRNSEYHFFFIWTISSYIARWKVSYLGRKLVKWEPNKRGSSWCDAFRLFFALLVPSGWICLPLVLFGLFIYKYIFAVFPKVLCFLFFSFAEFNDSICLASITLNFVYLRQCFRNAKNSEQFLVDWR